MNTELIGKIEKIGDRQDFPSGFYKRELILKTEENYPETLCVEFLKEKGDKVDGLAPGQRVKVQADIRGREHNGRYYTSLIGWKVDVLKSVEQPSQPEPAPVPKSNGDNLPF